ncbi:PTS sugar transporter subunit IIB [Coprothermobacteraceae bacterium]|nr:PTS sugar transporter subunit IIB [Coprothermobacteraceae bacterium]
MATSRLRVVTACGLGTGTALYLKMVVEEILRKLNVNASVETADSSLAPTIEADIIVTAPDLAESFKKRSRARAIVVVENYGDKASIEAKLRSAIEELNR